MRLATDFQTALLLATVIWVVWYWGPVLLDAIFDPERDRFDDVDQLAKDDRSTVGVAVISDLPPDAATSTGGTATPTT